MVNNMAEEKWGELMMKLMGLASELFSAVEDFKSGKLTAEVVADKQVKISITRDTSGKIKAELDVQPIEEKETTEIEALEPEVPETTKTPGEPAPAEEATTGEEKKEETFELEAPSEEDIKFY